ncbi:MAG: hypothetical protein RR090_09660 [Niameybacter sp.]|uniref:hypothetical protein n=1 Tax=Niameybacter sp. TaxID=2033640 RepID=UPI002FC766D0
MKRFKIPFIVLSSILGIALIIYVLLGFHAADNMFYVPQVDRVSIAEILDQSTFSQEDYDLLYAQTGIAQPMVDLLQQHSDFKSKMLNFQSNYFKTQNVIQTKMTPFTNIDKVVNENGEVIPAFELAPYENGYIFLSKSTYTYNWRHGHAGLVIDSVRGKMLESLEPFTLSMEQDASWWAYRSTFKMMRLKDVDQEYLDEIASFAATSMQGIPYNILAMKTNKTIPTSTHCSHIVWHTFKHFNIDLDSSGGIFVSPGDIGRSPYLETLQIYGFDPSKDW